MNKNEITQLRLRLVRAGFTVVPLFGKQPPNADNNTRKSFMGWTDLRNVTPDMIETWSKIWPDAINTGVLARTAPGLDLDILDVSAVEALEQLAREHFEEHGDILVRTGLPPKRLIPLRTDGEDIFAKQLLTATAPNGTEHRIEVLGDGQQYVVAGIHPVTLSDYTWHGGELGVVTREQLPYVRLGDIEKFFADAKTLLVDEFGYTIGAATAADAKPQHDKHQDNYWGRLNERALANLEAWVPRLFPSAKKHKSKNEWSVASADLGRGFEERLLITPRGCKWFGIADMGDKRKGRRSPLDLVTEFEHLDRGTAAKWLEDALASVEATAQARAENEAPTEDAGDGANEQAPPDDAGGSQQQQQGPAASAGAQQQQRATTPPSLLPPPTAPMAVARKFVDYCCRYNGTDELTLRYWRGGWWTWRTTHWLEIENRTVRSLLYAFTEHAGFVKDNKVAAWLPNRHKIGDLLEALGAIIILRDDLEQPCWIDGRNSGPMVAVENGLLEITTRQLHAHSPLYFNQTAVPFAYDPDAPEPTRWLNFLNEIWPDDLSAIDALGEWAGYVISGRLDLHKILLMVGPTRGGKGVIARIISALIGKPNVCGPTLNSLGGDFGLAPLIGKSLAVISDARFHGKNGGIVVERLLSISGEDTITVNRKFKDQWTGKLSTRIRVISNELPKLGDASTAIVGRFVLLLTTRSWLGKEDYELEPVLLTELTGVLNWALDGLERLTVTNGNRFTRVEASEEAIIVMRDLASPVAAFVRERCEVGSGFVVDVDVLYDTYKTWCTDNEHPKASKAVFGRDLRAAVPSIRKERPRGGGTRRHDYVGIGLLQTQQGAQGTRFGGTTT